MATRWFWSFVVGCVVWMLAPRPAEAYPWMVRHEYSGCAACHADPSGAGLLTAYGRAQSDVFLSSRYGRSAEAEPTGLEQFAFGVVKLPDNLLLGGFYRGGYLWNTSDGKLVDNRYLAMQADLQGQLTLGMVRFNASVGFTPHSAAAYSEQAWVTSNANGANLVSREHWVAVDFADQTMLVRAGRMNLPFGLRIPEHTSWVRQITRTDYNQSQQHGVAFAFNNSTFRAEIMGIAGNFQIRPDAYRERGYAGYFEWAIDTGHTVGVSSLVTHADSDLAGRGSLLRQAHGVFTRLALLKPLALLGEVNLLLQAPQGAASTTGYVGFLQGDLEPWQGVHVMATGEILDQGGTGSATQLGGWLGAAWYFFPHADLRFDAIRRGASGQPASMSYLAQLHFYLLTAEHSPMLTRPPLVSLVLAISLLAWRAEASPEFPGVVQSELQLATEPLCTLCHSTPSGGLGTVTTPFGSYLMSRGARANNTASIKTALAAASGEKHDSNGDGIDDVAALKAGNDPNASAGQNSDTPPVGYGIGCAFRAPSRHGSDPFLIAGSLLGLLVGAAFFRRK